MVSAFNILYSISAVRRMLGIAQGVSIRIQKFFFVIWVHVAGQRPTFISKKAFRQHFVDHRKAAARGLTATRDLFSPHIFRVRNEAKGTLYTIQTFTGGILCDCEDFKNQAQFFGKACCKHAYAVLFQLGHIDLRDYITRS
jgi:hypothetical protein